MRLEFEWHKSIPQISGEATKGEKGLLFLANEAKRLMDPYVPADNLVLAQNVSLYVEKGMGIVEYRSPYAHYQWEGKKYVDPKLQISGFYIPGVGWRSRRGVAKKPTDKSLKHSKFRHPLATSHWEKAMKSARGKDLANAYQAYLRGRTI